MSKMVEFLTDEDLEQISYSTSWVDIEFTRDEAEQFFSKHKSLYYKGKLWGFTDTEVREEMCGLIKKDLGLEHEL